MFRILSNDMRNGISFMLILTLKKECRVENMLKKIKNVISEGIMDKLRSFNKKSIFLNVLCVSCFVLNPNIAFSQIEIKGIVSDSLLPLQFAEVLLTDNQGKYITGTITDSLGCYTLKTKSGDYILSAGHLGYTDYKKKITLSENLDVDKIILSLDINSINEVEVIYKREVFERKVDRTVYNVKNTPLLSGDDGLEIMDKMPGVQVVEDNINVIGKEGVDIYLNDIPLNLTGEELALFLKSLTVSNIVRIEIITTPPAKYDKEGNIGIINIITTKSGANNFNGSVRNSISFSNKIIGFTGASLNYQRNKLSLNSTLNYTEGNKTPYREYNIKYPDYNWIEEYRNNRHQKTFSNRSFIEYKINSMIRVGGTYSYSDNSPESKVENHSDIINNKGIVDSIIRSKTGIETKKLNKSYSFYSIFNLDTTGSRIQFDIDRLDYSSEIDNQFFSNTFLSQESSLPLNSYSAENRSKLDIRIITSKLDFFIPKDWITLNFGVNLSLIDNKSNLFYNSQSDVIPVQSDAFQYSENIQAIYLSGNKSFEKIQFKLGIRGEYYKTYAKSEHEEDGREDYLFKVYPSVFITYSLKNQGVLSLTYSKRITRPPFNYLNPFRFYSTSYNYAEGNPFLQPYYSNSFECYYAKGSIYTSLYLNYYKDKFDQVTYVETDSNIQIVRSDNFYDQVKYGIYQGYAIQVGDFWEGTADATFYYEESESYKEDIIPSVSSWSGNFVTYNNFSFGKTKIISAYFKFFYQLPSLAGSYELSQFYQFDAGFKLSLLKNKFQIKTDVFDILHTRELYFKQIVNGIEQRNYDYNDVQRVKFSIVYSFGKKFNMPKQRNIKQEEYRLR